MASRIKKNIIVRKLAKRSILADKRRNVFIIITISFAVCLMTILALYTFGKSFELNTFLQNRYQASVVNIDLSTIKELSKNEKIQVGTEANINDLRVDDYTLNINYRDSNALELLTIGLTGHLPETEDEVAVSATLLEHLGLPVSINQKIRLPLKDGVEKDYTICGLISDDNRNRYYQVFVSEDFLHSYYQNKIPYKAILRISESSGIPADYLKEIILTTLLDYNIDQTDIAYSSSYFQSADNSVRDSSIIIAISVLIIISCSIVIYSMFYISVVGKIKEYGRLRLIGMTQQQIKRMVHKERNQLSLLSIPVGLLIGSIIGYILVPNGWYWPNTIVSAVGAAILTQIAIMLSVHKPVKIASSTSPIEAVLVTTTTENIRFIKTKKLFRKISPGILAAMNFSRNRKKVILTLFSLGFSGILLMCAATYLNSVDAKNIARQMFIGKEILVSLDPNMAENSDASFVNAYNELQKNNPLDSNLIQELLSNQQITEVKSLKGCYANLFMPENSNVESDPYYNICGLSKEVFNQNRNRILSGNIDYDTFVNQHGILIDDTSGLIEKLDHYKATIGDTIEIQTSSGEKIPFKIMGILDMNNSIYYGSNFFIPDELLSELMPEVTNFTTDLLIRTDLQELTNIEQLVFDELGSNPNLDITSYSDALTFAQRSLKAYTSPIYGLVIFISIFSIINLINTLMTNLVARQQEFGMLQSIGMSGKQLSKMLQAESCFYLLGTMVITLTLGTAAGFVLCNVFNQIGVFGELNYRFPLLQAAAFFTALFIIIAIYSLLAVHYCQRQTLVNRIKDVN